jgi:antitoxin (DNA-binding transcriptional repressor) of toxin-antitoxin stability system
VIRHETDIFREPATTQSGGEMAQSETIMKTITFDEFQRQLARLVQEVAAGKTRLTVEQDGEALVRLEPASTVEQREITALMHDADFRDLAAISEALKDYPLDELEEQIAQGLRDGRERRRKEREQAPPAR